MNKLHSRHFLVKFLVYLAAVFAGGFFLSILLGLIIPTKEEIADWQFSLAFALSFIITGILFIVTEHNALRSQREQALALCNDVSAIQTRTENVLFQLEGVMMSHMEQEAKVYLKVSKDSAQRFGRLRTLKEISSRLVEYPQLRSDQDVLRLFDEITRCHDQLMNQKTYYNKVAAQYNAGIQKFPASLLWKMEKLEYYAEPGSDTLVAENSG